MKRLIKITPIIFVLSLLIIQVPLASAQATLTAVFERTGTTTSDYEIYDDWHNESATAGLYTDFMANTSGWVTTLSLRLRNYASPTGNLSVGLATQSGTYGLNSQPASWLHFFPDIDSAALTDTLTWYNFTTNSPYYITLNTPYVIGILTYDNTGGVKGIDNTNRVGWGVTSGVAGSYGQYREYTWVPIAAYGLQLRVYVNTTDPAPSPTATAAPYYPSGMTYFDYLLDQLMDFLVPLLVMLLPALFLGWLTRWSKWPMIIGLAIGSGLGYMFVPGFPVWLIFLISLGIIGFAYSEVKRGN